MMKKFLLLSALCLIAITATYSDTHAAPAGFTNQLITAGLSLPTDFAFVPDGRILITLKNGRVLVYENNHLLSTPALDKAVSTGGDRGLISIALDPNFSSNRFVYLMYTTTANHQRISRFTMNGNTIDPGSEYIVLQNDQTWTGFLNAGAIRFGSDGKLYGSFGSNGTGTNAQDLSNLDGKFIRINSDGSIPGDNPFAATPGAQQAIYSYGLRNPWRFNFDQSGRAIIGDVGESSHEKIVRATAGANFGWPTVEGDCRPNCGTITPPLFTYPHVGTAGSAVVAGAVYTGTSFPAQYQGKYFFGDYVSGALRYINSDGSGALQSFEPAAGTLASIHMGLDGCLYYIDIFPGELHKICYGTVTSVTAQAAADITSGSTPLDVQFSSAGSTGTNLAYHWDFGDGAISSEANPQHTFTTQGVYTVHLRVTGSEGEATTTLSIWSGYSAPHATITSPTLGTTYLIGDTIFYSGTATDAQDGALPASAFKWNIVFHHNTHIHAPDDIIGVSSGTLAITPHEENGADTWYEIILTVTNSAGISTSVRREVHPRVTVTSSATETPTGLSAQLSSTFGFARALADIELWDTAKRDQIVLPLNLPAGEPVTLSWDTITAPPGTYTVKIGIFADDWSKLHSWNDNAGTITVQTSTAPVFSVQVTPDRTAYSPGQSMMVTSSVTVNQNLPDLLLDTELWGPAGKIRQWLMLFHGTPGATFNLITGGTAPPTPGIYTLKTGIFSDDWSHLYAWNDSAGSLTVEDSTGPVAFVVSGSLPKSSFAPGETTTITTNVAATRDIPNVVIHTEIYDPLGNQKAAHATQGDLIANQLLSTDWVTQLPHDHGQYVLKIGVFPSDYSQLLFWKNNASEFSVGAPLPSPTPGQIYPIAVTVPTDGGTVTGLTEIQAAISGLDINSYTLGWRTGSGDYFELDTDPVTKSFKHAWIDFEPWNWMPNHTYILDFEARDMEHRIIGTKSITVHVEHTGHHTH